MNHELGVTVSESYQSNIPQNVPYLHCSTFSSAALFLISHHDEETTEIPNNNQQTHGLPHQFNSAELIKSPGPAETRCVRVPVRQRRAAADQLSETINKNHHLWRIPVSLCRRAVQVPLLSLSRRFTNDAFRCCRKSCKSRRKATCPSYSGNVAELV